jgi:hypothetical protein
VKQAVLVSVDDLEGLEMTPEILGDTDAGPYLQEPGRAGPRRAQRRPGHRPARPGPAPRHQCVSTQPEQRYLLRFPEQFA